MKQELGNQYKTLREFLSQKSKIRSLTNANMKFLQKTLISDVYWQLSYRFKKLAFWGRKNSERLKKSYSLFRKSLSRKRFFWTLTMSSIISPILFIIILFLVEWVAANFNKSLEFVLHSISLTQEMSEAFLSFFLKVNDFFYWIIPAFNYGEDTSQILTTLFTIIATVSGVLLGLFYPLLASVVSSGFFKHQTNIRSILISEPVTQDIVKQLAFLTSFAVLLVISLAIGLQPNMLIVVMIGLMTIKTLFVVTRYGFGIFNYLNPAELIDSPLKDLFDYTNKAAIKSSISNDDTFQRYYSNEANKRIQDVITIIQISSSGTFSKNSPLESIFKSVTGFLVYYQGKKSEIPYNSKWFPVKHEYKSAFVADHHEKEMIGRASYFVQPNSKPDHRRIEAELLEAYINVIENYSGSERLKAVIFVLSHLSTLSECFGVSGDHESFSKLITILHPFISDLIKKDDDEIELSEMGDRMLILQLYSDLFSNYLMSLFSTIEKFDEKAFLQRIETIDWLDKESVYKNSIIFELNSQFRRYHLDALFEKKVEGKVVTPNWYIAQICSANYLEILKDSISEGLELFDKYFLQICTEKNSNKYLRIFSSLIGLQWYWRIERNLIEKGRVIEEIEQLIIQDEIIVYAPNIGEKNDRIKANKKALHKSVIADLPYLTEFKWDNTIPDIIGHAFYQSSLAISEAIFEEDKNFLKNNFKHYVEYIVKSRNSLKTILDSHNLTVENRILVLINPLISSLHLSGLLLVLSELLEDSSYYDICKSAWDEVLDGLAERDEFINSTILLYSWYDNPMYKYRASYLKYNFEGVLTEKLKQQNVFNQPEWEPIFKDHESLVLRALNISSGLNSYSFELAEVFIELYFATNISAKAPIEKMDRRFFKSLLREIEDDK